MNRIAILKGIQAAAEFVKNYNIPSDSSVDIFKLIYDQDIPLFFKELQGLLGATIKFEQSGILVTTQRPLSIQRFTAAHELGHILMNHEDSLDTESDIDQSLVSYANSPQEIEANAFASELLLSRDVLKNISRSMGIVSQNQIIDPTNIYQISLRTGTSYTATCYALARHFPQFSDLSKTFKISPKNSKQKILGKGFKMDNPWADVWNINLSDSQRLIAGSKDDYFSIELPEHTSGGYEWDLNNIEKNNLQIIGYLNIPNEKRIGAKNLKKILIKANNEGEYDLVLREKRSWESVEESINSLNLKLNLYGAESSGISRYEQKLLAA